MTAAPKRGGLVWSIAEDATLLAEFAAGYELAALAELHERTRAAIVSRLLRLGRLVEGTGRYHRVEEKPWTTFAEIKKDDAI